MNVEGGSTSQGVPSADYSG